MTKLGLKVKNVKEEAEGAYKCRISLPNNASLVKFVNLKVYAKPDHLNSDVGMSLKSSDDPDNSAGHGIILVQTRDLCSWINTTFCYIFRSTKCLFLGHQFKKKMMWSLRRLVIL